MRLLVLLVFAVVFTNANQNHGEPWVETVYPTTCPEGYLFSYDTDGTNSFSNLQGATKARMDFILAKENKKLLEHFETKCLGRGTDKDFMRRGCVCDPQLDDFCIKPPTALELQAGQTQPPLLQKNQDGLFEYVSVTKGEVTWSLEEGEPQEMAIPCPHGYKPKEPVKGKAICEKPCEDFESSEIALLGDIVDLRPTVKSIAEPCTGCQVEIDFSKLKGKCDEYLAGSTRRDKDCEWIEEYGLAAKGDGFVIKYRNWVPKKKPDTKNPMKPHCADDWNKLETTKGTFLCFKKPPPPDLITHIPKLTPRVAEALSFAPIQCGPTGDQAKLQAYKVLQCFVSHYGGSEAFKKLAGDSLQEEWRPVMQKSATDRLTSGKSADVQRPGKPIKHFWQLTRDVAECVGFWTYVSEGVWYTEKKKAPECTDDKWWECILTSDTAEERAKSRAGLGLRQYSCPTGESFPGKGNFAGHSRDKFASTDVKIMNDVIAAAQTFFIRPLSPTDIGEEVFGKAWDRTMDERWKTPWKPDAQKGEMSYNHKGMCADRHCNEMAILIGHGQEVNHASVAQSKGAGKNLQECISNAEAAFGIDKDSEWYKAHGEFHNFKLDSCIFETA